MHIIAVKAVALSLLIMFLGFLVKDDLRLINNSTLESAVISGCTHKARSRKSSRYKSSRGNVSVYASVAYTRSGEKATGKFIHSSRAKCEKRMYRDVSVFVHDFDQSKNRINGFFEFWLQLFLIGSCLLMVCLWLLRHQTGNRIFSTMSTVCVFGVAVGIAVTYWHDFESTPESKLAGDSTASTSDFSDNVLDQCIRHTLREGGYQHVADISKLSCQNMGITDLSQLKGLNSLEELYLQKNKLKTLQSMPVLPKLRVLSIAANKIESLSGIENAQNLQDLQSNKNSVSSIQALATLEKLETIAFMYNQVSDLTPLTNLQNLKSVNFNFNNISDMSALAGKTVLSELSLFSNTISDLSPLYESANLSSLGIVDGINRIPCGQVEHLLGKSSVKLHKSWREKCT